MKGKWFGLVFGFIFVISIENSFPQEANIYSDFNLVVLKKFDDKSGIVDLSELLIWDGNDAVSSAFTIDNHVDADGLMFPCIFLKPQAIGKGGYSSGSAFASTAFDVLFDKIYHQSNAICIEFDYISERLSGNGESGRLGVALLHDYPLVEPGFGDVYSLSAAPFGRPAYNLRLLNGTGSMKQAYLFYGGGLDFMGEFEKTSDQVWLPGFISGPGGISPGSVADYPVGSVKICNKNVVSDSHWFHYTWLINPEMMAVYRRRSELPAASNELLVTMATPFRSKPESVIINELSQFHNVLLTQMPTLYNWFEYFEGIRFFYRSLQNGYLANLKVSTQPIITSNIHPIKNLDNISVFPNQVVDQLHVKTAGMLMRCSIYSLTGTLIRQYMVKDNTVSLSFLPSGIYIVHLFHEGEDTQKSFKIFKK